jgi:hypothetical protein
VRATRAPDRRRAQKDHNDGSEVAGNETRGAD